MVAEMMLENDIVWVCFWLVLALVGFSLGIMHMMSPCG